MNISRIFNNLLNGKRRYHWKMCIRESRHSKKDSITCAIIEYVRKNPFDFLFTIITIEIIVLILLSKWYNDDIERYTSYLLQFSSVFSAIVLTFIISKIYSQRNENLLRKDEIEKLSNKVSDLRRIARILLTNDGLWPSELANIMTNDYSKLTHEIIESQQLKKDSKDKMLLDRYIDDKRFNKQIADLFIALRSLRGDLTDHKLFLYSNYDFNYTYRFIEIHEWKETGIANKLWYVFDYKYCNLKNLIHIENIDSDSEIEILNLARKINKEKYAAFPKLTNKVLSSIGSDFDSYYFKRLSDLLFVNRPVLPKMVNFSLNIMIIIMVFGGLLPVFFQTIRLDNPWFLKLTYLVFIYSISRFLIKIKKLLEDELVI